MRTKDWFWEMYDLVFLTLCTLMYITSGYASRHVKTLKWEGGGRGGVVEKTHSNDYILNKKI